MSKKKKNTRGKFIVFEGLDGAGTTTQAHFLNQYLEKDNWPVYTTNEPSQGPMGIIIRLVLSKRIIFDSSDNSMALLFAADRLDHVQHSINPKLEEGVVVICDRYYLSSYAYQMGKDRKNLAWLREINSKCQSPDLTIFLHASPAVCEKRRRKNRWHEELYEQNDFLRQVARNYDYVIDELLKENVPIVRIDGNPPEKVVFGEVLSTVKSYFPEMFPGDLPLFPT